MKSDIEVVKLKTMNWILKKLNLKCHRLLTILLIRWFHHDSSYEESSLSCFKRRKKKNFLNLYNDMVK